MNLDVVEDKQEIDVEILDQVEYVVVQHNQMHHLYHSHLMVHQDDLIMKELLNDDFHHLHDV